MKNGFDNLEQSLENRHDPNIMKEKVGNLFISPPKK
jgi:hypothetical protein